MLTVWPASAVVDPGAADDEHPAASGGVITAERSGRVLIISLRREHKRNAIDRTMADGLDRALNTLEDDPEIWAGVLTGTPTVFCAGSDLKADGDYVTARGGEYGIIRRARKKPLVAAVEGVALGGGMEIALACDMVVAARNAQFGLPEVSRGVLPTCGALFRALHALPPNIARQLVLTGEPIDASDAHAAGFVNVVCEPGDATAEALCLAKRICENAPLSVQACLAALHHLGAGDEDEGWRVTEEARATIEGSADQQEGIAAFFEKRRPRWLGR
ncbi:MAG: enoyl-CoA hydratase [Acidimicrobiaceae bacterium]